MTMTMYKCRVECLLKDDAFTSDVDWRTSAGAGVILYISLEQILPFRLRILEQHFFFALLLYFCDHLHNL